MSSPKTSISSKSDLLAGFKVRGSAPKEGRRPRPVRMAIEYLDGLPDDEIVLGLRCLSMATGQSFSNLRVYSLHPDLKRYRANVGCRETAWGNPGAIRKLKKKLGRLNGT